MQKNRENKLKEIRESCWNFWNRKVQIVDSSFVYTDLSKKHSDFCPLFKENEICHSADPDKFSCWNCYCPHYDVNFNDGENIGKCLIDSKDGKYTNGIWDCSDCLTPHIK